MLKTRLMSLLMCVLLLAGCVAIAESVPVAPEFVAGKMMAYVINNDGAAVYEDVFAHDADLEPVETIAYGTEIQIQSLGLGYCRLHSEDKEVRYVRTRDLSFSDEPFENQLAIVFLKRSNKLPLHKTESAKSKTITNVPDGSYVIVLEKGDTFSHVLYGKYEGYLQNSYLSFRVAWQGDIFQAELRDPEKPKRHTTVNLRSADSANGKKVAVVPTWNKKAKANTILTVLQLKGDWAEVETEKDGKGIHGYLKADWVEAIQPVPKEEASETAEEPAQEDLELKEGAANDSVELQDDEEEPAKAEDTELAPEWEEGGE